ncbi:enoyl-CoA hydratase/isomerase family protein [Streptomyces sp. NPDC094468]|uniref:enoyl-CoA hydratase/isomerase family protein n=1 Tax=Streptomyces sp. NPDC094468 TaxID=3366066 RepID=UPI003826EF7D
MTDYKSLLVTHDGPVLHVQLNRPDSGNAVSGEVLTDLLDVLHTLQDDTVTRVMVLSGAGPHFSQGGDRAEFPALLAEDPTGASLRALADKAERVCAALASLKIVTIARLHGDVIGAGLGLAVYCDLRIGANDCRFRMPEVGLGLPPAWGGVLDRLLAEAGQAWVRRLLLTSEIFDANKAQQLSIIHDIVAPADLDDAVHRLAKQAARRNPTAIDTTKRMLIARTAPHPAGVLDAQLLTSAAMQAAARRAAIAR